jgi:hypothetical protein
MVIIRRNATTITILMRRSGASPFAIHDLKRCNDVLRRWTSLAGASLIVRPLVRLID